MDQRLYHLGGRGQKRLRLRFSVLIMKTNGLEQLVRPRISELLKVSLNVPATAVVAGAGFGKTEATYRFLRDEGVKTAWVQISKLDNTPARFWDNFTRAIGQHDEEFADFAGELGFPGDSISYERFANALADMTANEKRFVVVFDDFHHICDSRVMDFLKSESDSSIRDISRIFISRELPEFFTSGRLLKHNAGFISEDDLRFTKEEMLEFFVQHGISLQPDIAERIYEDTAGWAFAIHLVGMILKQNPGAEQRAISAMKANVTRMLEKDVFGVLSESHQRALVKLSLLSNPHSSLVRRLADGEKLLESLGRGNAFVRYDEYHDSYHIHLIYREFLKEKLSILTEDERRNAWQSAAEWCIENGHLLDALHYFEKLGAYERILDLCFDLSLNTPAGVMEAIVKILGCAPAELFDKDARAYILYVRFLMNLGKIDAAETLILEKKGEMEECPDSEYRDRLLFGLNSTLGYISMIRSLNTGDYDFARHFQTADSYFKRGKIPSENTRISFNLGPFANRVGRKNKGDFEKYIAALKRSVPSVAHYMNGCMSGLYELAVCEIAFYRGDADECEKYARLCADSAQRNAQYEIENRAYFFLLRSCLYKGKLGELASVLELIKNQALESDFSERYKFFETIIGWFYAQLGYEELVPYWLKREPPAEEIGTLNRGPEFFTKVKYLLLCARYRELLVLLEEQDSSPAAQNDSQREGDSSHMSQRYHSLGSAREMGMFLIGRIGLWLNRAICHYHLKNGTAALHALKEAYALSKPNAIIAVFVEAGNDMRALSEYALKKEICGVPRDWLLTVHAKASTYAKRLSQAKPQIVHPQNSPEIRLTKAEKEMLKMLSTGMSRKDIAGAGKISINTVKTILGDAIDKLDAHNATEAVSVALIRGLI